MAKNYQDHYDNSKGSLYKIANDLGLNSFEFDILKRVCRCRKKGQFREDLQKTKDVIDLYLEEYVDENTIKESFRDRVEQVIRDKPEWEHFGFNPMTENEVEVKYTTTSDVIDALEEGEYTKKPVSIFDAFK